MLQYLAIDPDDTLWRKWYLNLISELAERHPPLKARLQAIERARVQSVELALETDRLFLESNALDGSDEAEDIRRELDDLEARSRVDPCPDEIEHKIALAEARLDEIGDRVSELCNQAEACVKQHNELYDREFDAYTFRGPIFENDGVHELLPLPAVAYSYEGGWECRVAVCVDGSQHVIMRIDSRNDRITKYASYPLHPDLPIDLDKCDLFSYHGRIVNMLETDSSRYQRR